MQLLQCVWQPPVAIPQSTRRYGQDLPYADNGDDSALKSNSRYSPVQILPASSSNSAPRPSVVFNILKWKSSSRHNPVHLFQQLSQMEARNRGNRDPIRRPREPLYWKKRIFRGEKCFHLWIRTLPICYTPRSGWYDGVVAMMRHEHDDKTAPAHWSVTRKFSN